MAFVAQSDTVRNIGKLAEQFCSVVPVGFNDNGERSQVMGLNPEIHRHSFVISPSAFAASVIIPMQDSGSPRPVFRRLSQRVSQRGNSSLPTPMRFPAPQRLSTIRPFLFNLLGLSPMAEIDVLGDRALGIVSAGDFYGLAAAAEADVSPSVFGDECLDKRFPGIGSSTVISKVRAENLKAFRKSSSTVTAGYVEHICKHREINGSVQVKSGELQETPLAKAKGNLQPSRRYTGGRFRDYRSGTARLITGFSARLSNTRDEIVHAPRNRGMHSTAVD